MAVSNIAALQAAGTYFETASDINVANEQNLSNSVLAHMPSFTGTHHAYVIASETPFLAEWVGTAEEGNIRVDTLTLAAKPYVKRITVPIELANGSPQIIKDRIDQGMAEIAVDKEKLISDVIFAAFDGAAATDPNLGLGYDGLYLFSASHTGLNGAAQSNTSTNVLNALNLQAALAAMESFVDRNGRPMGSRARKLVVGPSLKSLANLLVYGQQRPFGISATNVEANASVVAVTSVPNYVAPDIDVVVNQFFVGARANYWLLVDDSKSIKPVVLGMQSGSEMKTNNLNQLMDDPNARFQYQVTMSRGAGPWQLIWGSTGAGS